ncbi:MAG: sulfatase-like hydrolase/transferase, partial [Verrucomicrobiales bacterium]
GYLASVSFADAMLGRLLDALEQSPNANNTIVVLWSDHGWQLGEKQHWRKFALWDNVARCPLFIRLPDGTSAGEKCQRVTSLMDIYPTLLALCQLPPRPQLDGRSLLPLLEEPSAEWDHPALTSYDITEFAVTTEDWRYIRYLDDSEELYDLRNDPEEWHNLAGSPEHTGTKALLAAAIPPSPAPLRPESLIELQSHHVPPYTSKEDYRRRRSTTDPPAGSD